MTCNEQNVARLATFTIALLLLTEALEPGWGVQPDSGWYIAICLLTLMTIWDLLSLVTFVISLLLLVGWVDESRAAFIALAIFAGAAVLKPAGGTFALTTRWWSHRVGHG